MDDVNPQSENVEEPKEPVVGDAPPKAHTLFSNAVYDKLKFLAQIVLPAVATLYLSVAGLWELPEPEKVAGTIMAVDFFLGVLLGISTNKYKEEVEGPLVGALNVTTGADGNKLAELEFDADPYEIDQHDRVTLVVRRL